MIQCDIVCFLFVNIFVLFVFTVVITRCAHIYCCHRITEQHSREVSEMDHLLQEELQQARANQQQNVSETHCS